MIYSMTAYGRAEHEMEGGSLLAEIRSVNNRYREVILRMPKNYQHLEEELKRLIGSRVRRGRLEVSIEMERNGEAPPYELELNEPLVQSYIRIFRQLEEVYGMDAEIRPDTFSQFRDIIVARPEKVDTDQMDSAFRIALEKALDSYDHMRRREGEAIEEDFRMRLEIMEKYVRGIEERIPEVVEMKAGRLKERIASMIGDVEIDEARLAQEVAILAEKSDITEELVRIKSHLKQFEDFLSKDDALGRRLDFLVQEINREVNTLSAKASDAFISGTVVEMKAELEKLREQIQNVE